MSATLLPITIPLNVGLGLVARQWGDEYQSFVRVATTAAAVTIIDVRTPPRDTPTT